MITPKGAPSHKNYKLSPSERAKIKRFLAKIKKQQAEPDLGELRGRYRPTKAEFEEVLNHVKELKNFVVRKQAYSLASHLRDIERIILNVRDAHPEQGEKEVFFFNVKDGDESWKKANPHAGINSLRLGGKAYTEDLKKTLKGYKPLFATLNEGYSLND